MGHIKAQVLADFITKLIPIGETSNERKEWTLSIDGASNRKGSGTEIILEGSDRLLIEQSLWFEFWANNNQVEYEALLASMKLVEELGVQVLMAKSDSQLVIGQKDTIPENPQEARKLRKKASSYVMVFQQLYR
ncbi:hypothetical protein CR513_48911, partial [Mucuna pruriens]